MYHLTMINVICTLFLNRLGIIFMYWLCFKLHHKKELLLALYVAFSFEQTSVLSVEQYSLSVNRYSA